VLAEVRAQQPADSTGFRGLSSAMALLALSEGDIGTFRRIAGELDRSLGSPVRVPPAQVEVLSLYRAIQGADLPVNAPEEMKPLRRLLLDARRAAARSTGVQS